MLDRDFPVARFHEVQYFHQRWRLAILAGLVAVFLYGSFQQLVQGRPWGLRPVPNALLLLMTVGIAALLYWLLKMHLITEVRERGVFLHFRLLWKPRQFPFSAILSVEPVSYQPMEQFGGRGIRRGRHGWAYTVSGTRGVDLKLAGGEHFLIGSQRAEELAATIRRHMQDGGYSEFDDG
jgi:hypothetical protein